MVGPANIQNGNLRNRGYMGVDAGIFAKKAKKYFWYDRDYHLTAHMNENVPGDVSVKCEDIRWRLRDGHRHKVTAEEVIFLANSNIRAWLSEIEDQQHHHLNVLGVKEFAEAYPDDEFFIDTDSQSAYEYIGEMNGKTDGWSGEYTEWKPKE